MDSSSVCSINGRTYVIERGIRLGIRRVEMRKKDILLELLVVRYD
jgi:hypothetical protein